MKKFDYPSPLELPDDVVLGAEVIEFNGVPFQKRSDCTYKHDYVGLAKVIEQSKSYTKEEVLANPGINEVNLLRNLMQEDLWFIVYFVLKNPLANHPFIVEACKEIEDETEDSLEVWARDHLKSTIITIAHTCKIIFNDPERRIGLFSATRPLALAFLKVIRNVLESPFVFQSFPDILYKDPYKEAEKWSEAVDGGLIVKRRGFFKEPTVSAWGLTEGMPTGFHLTDLIYDDIVVHDMQSPEIMQKVKDNFDISENLGTRDRRITVVGTFYNHDDPLVYIQNKCDPVTAVKLFKTRKKAATENGELNGAAVFLPELALAKKRASNLFFFYCQQLLDPTPRGARKLNRKHLVRVSKADLPKRLHKVMLVDPAGNSGKRADGRKADAWAFGVMGIEPYVDDSGASNIYILDLVIEEMDLVKAINTTVDMYSRGGRINKLAIEKVGISTTEIHIARALKAKGKYISEEKGNLHILRPGGREKKYRIESNLCWPLLNSKIHYLDSIPTAYIERLMLEMDKFPYWHDDGLDMLSYTYDVIKDTNFSAYPQSKPDEDAYMRAKRRRQEAQHGGWITV